MLSKGGSEEQRWHTRWHTVAKVAKVVAKVAKVAKVAYERQGHTWWADVADHVFCHMPECAGARVRKGISHVFL